MVLTSVRWLDYSGDIGVTMPLKNRENPMNTTATMHKMEIKESAKTDYLIFANGKWNPETIYEVSCECNDYRNQVVGYKKACRSVSAHLAGN